MTGARRSFASRLRSGLSLPLRMRDAIHGIEHRLRDLERRIRYIQEALGRVESRQLAERHDLALHEREFRVYSQWGEDGIIDHLVRHVPIPRPVFVEFGVESYEEANTRFLLVNRNWSGLVIDGDAEAVRWITRSRDYWLYNLKAMHAFVTRENINGLLADAGLTGEIGLLSIDIDGMDYWIWEAIDVVSPAIVVIEYNSRLGIDEAVTVPYDPAFDRRRAHHSILYYGASLRALHDLGDRKGYDLVGCGTAGLNAFFVRRDLRPREIPAVAPEQAFRVGQFCEAHDEHGRRIRMSDEAQRALVRGMPLVEVGRNGSTAG